LGLRTESVASASPIHPGHDCPSSLILAPWYVRVPRTTYPRAATFPERSGTLSSSLISSSRGIAVFGSSLWAGERCSLKSGRSQDPTDGTARQMGFLMQHRETIIIAWRKNSSTQCNVGILGKTGHVRGGVMAKVFKAGDHVTWNSEAGRVTGVIIRRVTSNIVFKGYTHHASKEDPQYIIQSDKTDHQAIHKGSALRLFRRRTPSARRTRRKQTQ
jgi:hypothetical protein